MTETNNIYRSTPSIYASQNEPINNDYPLFKTEIADFCEEVNDTAQAVINKSGHISVNDFIPKIKFSIFGIFSGSSNQGDDKDSDKMDGPGRAMAIIAGGIVAGIASFVFGSFYSDYQEAALRLEDCESMRMQFPDVWQIRNDGNVKDVKFIIDAEIKAAESQRRSAIINMALTVSVIATGVMLVVAGVFAYIPLAIGAAVFGISVCVFALAKFGMNYFDKKSVRQAKAVVAAIERLKEAAPFVPASRAQAA